MDELRHTYFVSFSGIDGAGKSTQIEALCGRLRKSGLRILLISFWDDIARLTKLREGASHSIFKGDKGVGSPSAPINRQDKNVRSWGMTCVRLFLYFADAFSLRLKMRKALRSEVDLVIFDRFMYDELANLALQKRAIRAYVWVIMKIVPKPHISYLLDADPAKARARKPEYPIEFLRTNRQSYLALRSLVGGMTVIHPMPIEDVERVIFMHAFNKLSFKDSSTGGTHDATLIELNN
ncbi:MAG: thymidylate kinase [Terracidiphilus sp.]|jgi:thymidylate kinase